MSEESTIINEAILFCERHKERLTKPRLEVLKIIVANSQPLGAYQILEQLGTVIESPKPPTAYRAIEFWQDKGFIHRIESLNAYVLCQADHRHEGGQFVICDDCDLVIETHVCDLPEPFKKGVIRNNFTPSHWSIEIHGKCFLCQAK